MKPTGTTPWRPLRAGLALLGFLAVAAFFLLSEHRAHALGILPYALVLLCLLLHLWHHRGHGGNGREMPSRRDTP
jgi:hypothetical protein